MRRKEAETKMCSINVNVIFLHLVEVDSDSVPVGGDDAVDAKWVNINKLTEQNVAGDHSKVIDILRE